MRLFLSFIFSFQVFSVSGLDQIYRLSRKGNTEVKIQSTSSPGVSFYRRILSQTLSTSCDFYPSDSRKALIDFKNCQPGVAILKAMERYFLEPNAGELKYDVARIGSKNFFIDMPSDCNIFSL